MAELLFWPALLLYGEAAVGYFGEVRRPGRAGRAATWGVRLGWLAQTALLAVQATRDDGFPWGTWASSLYLFVWLVVSAYLIWGCRRPYRLLGLVVMPLAVALLVVARAGGGTGNGSASHYSNLFLVVHVGLVLAAFAGFTLAAALSGLYIWQERRLRTRPATILRRQMPALATLDSLALRTVAWSVPLLTLGAAVGLVRLARRRRSARRAHRRDRRDVARLVRVSRPAPARRLDGTARRVSRARRLRRSSSSSGSPSRRPTSRDAISSSSAPRTTTLRSSCASRSRSTATTRRRWLRGSPRTDARPSASRPATAPSSTSPPTMRSRPSTPRSPRSPRSGRRSSRRSTVCRTGPQRTTSSASPPVSTRSSRARARSSARCGLAHELGTTGPLLDRVFRQALHAGRKVRARDGDRREPGVGVVGGGRARGAGLRQSRGPLDPPARRGQGERAGRAQPPQPRRRDRARRQQQDGARANRRGARAASTS